ncbi:hypothetical protein V8Z69_16605 [Microbacterium aurugineum]|uniref:RCC1 domain-containing protein n=1 Tax=Microbacterium TaxID=33882 RepID=UPI001E524DE9|nr:hypothetical protein [Microbacterium sp. KKR3/1]MCE0509032.1 hypothetical protein [Microbacterium sp. KKR3/1]
MTTRRRRRFAAFTAAVVVAVAGSVLGASQGSVAQFVDTGRVQSSLSAVDSVPLSFVGIDAGENYSMGWTAAGEIFTWGGNGAGQLGNGTSGGSRLVPEQVMLPSGVQIVKADGGLDTVIALASDGGVYTWGNATVSGTSHTPTRSAFFDALGDPVVGVSSGGYYYLAWTESGALYSWGTAGGGRLGRSATGQSPPARVTAQGLNLVAVESAAAGRFAGIAQVEGGAETIAWGTGFGAAAGVTLTGITSTVDGVAAGTNVVLAWGQDGSLFSATSATASAVVGATDIVGVDASFPAAGSSSFYAWRADGALFAWGDNSQGQLGLGTTGGSVPSPTPVTLAPGSVALQTGAGADHALYLGQDGTFSSAGSNAFGQLGTGDTTPRNTFGSAITILRWP